MMISFQDGFWFISLVLAISSIVLLVTSELLSSYYGKINVNVKVSVLKKIAFVDTVLFLVTLVIRIAMILTE